MARGLDATYRMRPHLRVIGDAMADVLAGLYDRLLVITPPQVGKSSLVAEWGPFWWFANRPGDDIVIASYGADLAIDRSKGVREHIDEFGAEYGLAVRPGSGASDDWTLTTGGHLRAVGVGGALSGFPANCLGFTTSVRTPFGELPIGAYVESGCTADVLAYDHAGGGPVWAPVVATSVNERHVVDVVTRRGRTIRCTPDHRFYVPGRGYMAAADLRPGDNLYSMDVGSVQVQPMREDVPTHSGLPRHASQVGFDTVALVRPVCGDRVRVYDLQVAGPNNFFAGAVLVHNCIIVDDPHKDRAEAESPRMRKLVHDWWSSTASKRLQPDMGAVVAIQTRWHEKDFAGQRLEEEGRLEEGGRWKVVHLPAVADPKFGKDPLGREPGEPLTHPKIPTRDRARLSAWWADMKRTSIVRDWHSLAQGDPQPTEGALVTDELLRALRDTKTPVVPQKIAVAVDPSGGGRDAAGIVGGFLGDDGRLWITHDRSGVMSSADWSRQACLLAHETNAAILIYEKNYGGDMVLLVIRSAWEALVKEGRIPADKLPPQMKWVHAKQGKLLRAEPIAQQMILDRVRLRGLHVDLERQWATWQPTDPLSPGNLDASVYLAYGLLPIPSPGSTSMAGVQQMAQTNLLPWGR